jgi:hypothetical protein
MSVINDGVKINVESLTYIARMKGTLLNPTCNDCADAFDMVDVAEGTFQDTQMIRSAMYK